MGLQYVSMGEKVIERRLLGSPCLCKKNCRQRRKRLTTICKIRICFFYGIHSSEKKLQKEFEKTGCWKKMYFFSHIKVIDEETRNNF